MFGDVPDPSITTTGVGSGTAFRRAREEVRGLTGELRLGLAVGSGLCRKSWAERREERDPATISGNRKRSMFDRLYCRYSYSLGRQTDSECDEIWQAAY